MRIVLPKNLVKIDPSYGPLFFLAGPVRGGGDWQSICCLLLKAQVESFYAAIPCRYGKDHLLTSVSITGKDNHFPRQLNWERHYLVEASRTGCILFWLPCESKIDPRPKEDGPYARDTMGELGEWRAKLGANQRLRVVVGAEEGFSGLDVIRRNFSLELGYDFPIYRSLEGTVAAAISKATQ